MAAYTDEEEADGVALKANAHELLRPSCPEATGNSSEILEIWDKYDAAVERWRKKHPADPFHDTHYIVTIPLR